MAAKKIPMRKPVAKKPVAKKPVAKKPIVKKAATRTLTRAESIAMGKGSSAKSRKDFAGTTGFGDTTQSFSGVSGVYKPKSVKSAENYLKSKGVNPNSYTNKTGGNKGKSPKYDMAASSAPSLSPLWSKAYWSKDGGATVNGIPRIFKNRNDNNAYKRVTAEIKLKSTKPSTTKAPKKKK